MSVPTRLALRALAQRVAAAVLLFPLLAILASPARAGSWTIVYTGSWTGSSTPPCDSQAPPFGSNTTNYFELVPDTGPSSALWTLPAGEFAAGYPATMAGTADVILTWTPDSSLQSDPPPTSVTLTEYMTLGAEVATHVCANVPDKTSNVSATWTYWGYSSLDAVNQSEPFAIHTKSRRIIVPIWNAVNNDGSENDPPTGAVTSTFSEPFSITVDTAEYSEDCYYTDCANKKYSAVFNLVYKAFVDGYGDPSSYVPHDLVPWQNMCKSTSGDPVNLATGTEDYPAPADIEVYNPDGPDVVYQRVYHSMRAIEQSDKPSLCGYNAGWVDNYDVRIVHAPESYPEITGYALLYPNGSVDDLGNQNKLDPPMFAPYIVAGKPKISPNHDPITVTWKDLTKWVFDYNASREQYLLCHITDAMDHTIDIVRGPTEDRPEVPDGAINVIKDPGSATALLTFHYDGPSPAPSSIEDRNGRVVYYGYTQDTPGTGEWLLTSVQPVAAVGYQKWTYEYRTTTAPDTTPTGNLLNKISRPGPVSTTPVCTQITYEATPYYSNGVYRVQSTRDSKGDKYEYAYDHYVMDPEFHYHSGPALGHRKYEATHVTLTDSSANVAREYIAYSDTDTFKTLGSFESGRYSYVFYDQIIIGPRVCDETGCYQATMESPLPASTIDGSGKFTSYDWDWHSNLTAVTIEAPPTTNGIFCTKQATKYYYGEKGFPYLTAIESAYGDAYTIDPFGMYSNPTSGGMAARTRYVFDSTQTGISGDHGLLTSILQPVPGSESSNPAWTTTSFTYDGLGNVRTITGRDSSNNVIRKAVIAYDGTLESPTSKRPSSVSISKVVADDDPNNPPIVTYFTWNPDGTLHTVQDALGCAVDYTYTADHLVAGIVKRHAGSPSQGVSSTAFSFDPVGGELLNVGVSDLTAGTNSTIVAGVNFAYDDAGVLSGVSGDTETFSRTLDPLGRITSLTDGGTHTTNYAYTQGPPAAGSPNHVTSTDSSAISYPRHGTGTYDRGSATDQHATQDGYSSSQIPRNVVVTDGNGVTKTLVYAAGSGVLTDVVYPSHASENLHFEYDQLWRVKVLVHGACGANWQAAGANYQDIELYTYDTSGRPLTTRTRYPGLAEKQITYTYHPDGSRASMAVSGVSQQFTYTYNLAGQMTAMYNPFWGNYTWIYDNAGRLTWENLVGADWTQYGYDGVGRLNSITNYGQYNSQYNWFYSSFQGTRDALGNLTSMNVTYNAQRQPRDWNNPGNSCFIGTRTYQYRTNSQAHPYGKLYKETSNASIGYTNNFSYDDAYNMTNCRGIGGYSPIITSYNADNQDTHPTYDGNGNPSVRSVWISSEGETNRADISVGFDVENRLTSYNGYTFAGYRGDGLRAWKQSSSGARTYFVYDGGVPVAEYNSSGTLTAVNVFGANGLASRWTSDHGSTHYVFDLKGNVAQYAYQDGTYNNADYDAYGMNYVNSYGQPVPIPMNEPWGYGAQWGYYTDNETQSSEGVSALVLCGHRYYDPHTGRFLTRDPIGYDGGINLYAFCGNDPVNFADPWGTNAFTDWYWGGMGGLSEWVDKHLMGGSTEEFGTSVGVYEAGCGSLGQVVWSGTKWGAQLVYNAVSIVDGAKALSSIPSALKTAACFTAGTTIAMADGSTKAIEQIKEGDLVLTRDQHDDANGKVVAKKVVKTSVRQALSTLTLTLTTGERIECTPEHPFYVEGRGFVEASDLGIGTSIVTRAGPAIQVAGVERHDRPATVYNFVVEDTHTYFVGTANGGVEAHNGPCNPITDVEGVLSHVDHGGPEHWEAVQNEAIDLINNGETITINTQFPGTRFKPDITVWDSATGEPTRVLEVVKTSRPDAAKLTWLNSQPGGAPATQVWMR